MNVGLYAVVPSHRKTALSFQSSPGAELERMDNPERNISDL